MTLRVAVFLILWIGTVFGQSPEKGCGNNPADIVFVLDESGSIWGPHFKQQLEFVQQIVSSFDVAFNRTHIGVMTFSTDNRIIFQLGKYTNEAAVKSAVKAIQQKRGDTYTHLALKRMREEMFSRAYSRPWVRHVAIIITDGESNFPPLTKEEAAKVHQQNIDVFAIGVGTAVTKSELDAIASAPNYVYRVDSYDALTPLKQILAWEACKPPTTPTPPPTTTTPKPTTTTALVQMIQGCEGRKKMDHIWSMSDQAGVDETNLALDFIRTVTETMTIDPDHIQVGVAPRFCDEAVAIRLKDQDSKSGFYRNLERRRITGLRLDRTLQYIWKEGITVSNGGRSDAVKYGILIIDNLADDWEKTLSEAKNAKKAGVRLIVIGIGPRVKSQRDKLEQLATSADDYFYTDSYSGLADLESDVVQSFCRGIRTIEVQPQKRFFENFWEY